MIRRPYQIYYALTVLFEQIGSPTGGRAGRGGARPRPRGPAHTLSRSLSRTQCLSLTDSFTHSLSRTHSQTHILPFDVETLSKLLCPNYFSMQEPLPEDVVAEAARVRASFTHSHTHAHSLSHTLSLSNTPKHTHTVDADHVGLFH